MPNATAQPDPHCPVCGYSLRGTAEAAPCPECGLADAPLEARIGPLHRPWLHRYAMLCVAVTFVLIIFGGTVTSKGVGMAVPDWPTTYGYNMFLFPPSMWKGGVFWEHTHRLLGSLVGMLTIGLTVWLWVTNGRRKGRPWLRWLGVAALALVIVQGVMGGLRVTEFSITLAIIHGITAQHFLCMMVLIAAATSAWWRATRRLQVIRARDVDASGATAVPAVPGASDADTRRTAGTAVAPEGFSVGRGLRRLGVAVFIIVVAQLALGAAMRHLGAGLAIPDFPASYGQVIPPLTQEGIDAAIDSQTSFEDMPHYFKPVHVGLHFAHRAWAIAVVAGVLVLLGKLRPLAQAMAGFHGPALALLGLLLAQIALGATVIWSGKPPEIATAHQTTGALLLATLTLLVIRIFVATRAGSPRVSPEAMSEARPVKARRGERATEGGPAGAQPSLSIDQSPRRALTRSLARPTSPKGRGVNPPALDTGAGA